VPELRQDVVSGRWYRTEFSDEWTIVMLDTDCKIYFSFWVDVKFAQTALQNGPVIGKLARPRGLCYEVVWPDSALGDEPLSNCPWWDDSIAESPESDPEPRQLQRVELGHKRQRLNETADVSDWLVANGDDVVLGAPVNEDEEMEAV